MEYRIKFKEGPQELPCGAPSRSIPCGAPSQCLSEKIGMNMNIMARFAVQLVMIGLVLYWCKGMNVEDVKAHFELKNIIKQFKFGSDEPAPAYQVSRCK